jgi:hypothetical protein
VCPLEVDANDDDDYGSDSEIPFLPSSWKTMEAARCEDALEHERRGREYRRHTVPPSAELGLWAGKEIETIEDAVNLLRWIARTEPTAFHRMHCERVRLSSDPTILRTEGQVYLLQRQNEASTQYWLTTTGRRKGPKRYSVSPAWDADSGSRADEDAYVYLGTALLGDDNTVVILPERAAENADVRSGSHTKLLEAARLYNGMEHLLWPLGFRISERAYPDREKRFETVYMNDVSAWYTINALAPRRNRVGTSIHRAKFMEILIRTLSIAGTYNRVAQLGEYVFTNRPLEHYPFQTLNIDFGHVVSWLIQHGIARDGEAINTLESFARARRALTDGQDTPNVLEFRTGDTPRTQRDMLSMDLGRDFAAWATLAHAPLQDGVVSVYPRRPGHPDGMDEDTPPQS